MNKESNANCVNIVISVCVRLGNTRMCYWRIIGSFRTTDTGKRRQKHLEKFSNRMSTSTQHNFHKLIIIVIWTNILNYYNISMGRVGRIFVFFFIII